MDVPGAVAAPRKLENDGCGEPASAPAAFLLAQRIEPPHGVLPAAAGATTS